jgi:hypothetical protein
MKGQLPPPRQHRLVVVSNSAITQSLNGRDRGALGAGPVKQEAEAAARNQDGDNQHATMHEL